MTLRAGGRLALVHVVALVALAVTYPLLEVLGRGPEFFIAHRLEGTDLAAFVLFVAVVLPALALAVAWLARRLGRWPGAIIIGVLRVTLAACVVLQAIRALALPGLALVSIAVAAGVLLDLGCRFARPVALFIAFLAPAVVVAPILFVVAAPASRLFGKVGRTATAGGPPGAPAPVVFVVFDQLPLVSLLDGDGTLDRAAYPNFARLADTATWFRRTTSVSDRTEFALPALLTGRYPYRKWVPTAADHPDSLFTGLAPSYAMHVLEPMTRVCPSWLCPDGTPLRARLASATADAALVYLHRLLPPDLAAALPEVRHDWRGFWHEDVQSRFSRQVEEGRLPYRWVEEIHAPGRQPTLHFVHVLLPHEPYVYLPSGQQATHFGHLPGVVGKEEEWIDDEGAVISAYQRHLLQVGAADRFLGRLLDRLEDVRLFDPALIVVTADHGVSFRPGAHFKEPDWNTFPDIMSVPFLLKLPRQRAGRISDRATETIDILPTLADALKASLPGTRHGRSALRDDGEPRREVRIDYDACLRRLRTTPERVAEATLQSARRKVALFGEGPAWTPRVNFWPQLVGRLVADLPMAKPSTLRIELDSPERYRVVDPGGAFVPALLTGYAESDAVDSVAGRVLAVAVNGIVRATARVVSSSVVDRGSWSAIIRPDGFRHGSNDVAVYEVQGAPPRLALRPTRGGPWGESR